MIPELVARFVAGPYGTEDTDDSATMDFHALGTVGTSYGPDLLAKHSVPIRVPAMEADGLGGEIPRKVVNHQIQGRNEVMRSPLNIYVAPQDRQRTIVAAELALRRSMERRQHPGSR